MQGQASQQKFQAILLREFEARRTNDSAYSLRSFSRFLGVSPGALSECLRGQRPLGKKTALRIADKLCLPPNEKDVLLGSAAGILKADEASEPHVDIHQLEMDQFHAIADWYHYAIINLAEIKGARATPEHIATRLGISGKTALTALQRLQRLGLIKVDGGKFIPCDQNLSTSHDIKSTALRRFHAQNLDKAKESLHRDDVATRDITSISMAIDPALIPKAKDEIKKFRRRLALMLNSGDKRRVYMLAMQLFPLDQTKGG